MTDTTKRCSSAVLDRVASATIDRSPVHFAGGMASSEAWQVFARYVLNDSPELDRAGGPVADEHHHDVRCRRWRAVQQRHFGFFILVESRPAGGHSERCASLRALIGSAASARCSRCGAVTCCSMPGTFRWLARHCRRVWCLRAVYRRCVDCALFHRTGDASPSAA